MAIEFIALSLDTEESSFGVDVEWSEEQFKLPDDDADMVQGMRGLADVRAGENSIPEIDEASDTTSD